MFKALYRKIRNKEFPVFNLEINRDKSFPELREIDNTSRYIGEFIVYNSGRLEIGIDDTLHCFTAELKYWGDHLHLNGNIVGINHTVGINHNTKSPFLDAKFINPRLTLGRFYITHFLVREEGTLVAEIQKFNQEFEFNSIARHERTRVKLLENTYRKYVSDQ